MKRPNLKFILIALTILALSSLGSYLYFRNRVMSMKVPTPPDSYYLTNIPEDFKCEPFEVKGSMPIKTTPEGLSLRGGLGIQILCQYNPPEKVLVYVAFMKVSNEEIAKQVALDIVKYVNSSKSNYTEWNYSLGDKWGIAYFDYPGLRWEMWYRGRWIIEVGVGRSGAEGAEIVNKIKSCVAKLGRG